jgi:hypothetical protein
MAIIPSRNFNPGTLTRFGVPAGAGVNNGTILMPKLKHRFRVAVTNFGDFPRTIDFTRQVATAGRPQIQHNNTPLHSYNNVVYLAQKPEWQTIEIALRDDINNSVSALVSAQLQKQMNHYTQSAARSHMNYKFTTYMQTLDGSMSYPSNVLEEWMLEGCYLEQVQYDQMDYSSSDPVMITLTVRYDNATQGSELLTAGYQDALSFFLSP